MFLAHSPQGVNIAIEPNNNVAANVTGQSAGHGPAASPAAASPASPVAPPSEDNTTPAVLETPDHLRGISYNVQVLSWYTVDEYNRRKMDDLDHCIGVEHPSCVSCLNPCGGGLAGSNVPWFFNGKLDCRDTSASVLHDGVQISIPSHIAVDAHFPGRIDRDHAIYIGRPRDLPSHFLDRVNPSLVDVPCVVHLRRSQTNMKAATICVSSLADFKQKSILYEYDDWDEHGVKPEMSLAMAMDFVPGREIRYDWHHASSGHWASWCMEGRFASKEAENAHQKMYNVFDFAKAVGFLGLIALLVKV
eukprot:2708237-Rhodomonas_salina.1